MKEGAMFPSYLSCSVSLFYLAKTGDPREKPPDHPQAELDSSHVSQAGTHSGEMMSD